MADKESARKYLREEVDPIMVPLLESLLRSRPARRDIPAFVTKYLTSATTMGVDSGLSVAFDADASVMDTTRLRARLKSLGSTSSLEVGPGDLLGKSGQGDGPLTKHWQALPPGSIVFVNWVDKTFEHGDEVARACEALHEHKLCPVPHLPACRFEDDDAFSATLAAVTNAGATEAMILGGNDCFERAGELPKRFSDAGALLLTPMVGENGAQGSAFSKGTPHQLYEAGVQRVCLGGYPEGHPGLGFDHAATEAMLLPKVRALLEGGLAVSIAAQFTFDPLVLVAWLRRTRAALKREADAVDRKRRPSKGEGDGAPSGRAPYCIHVGIPGPTPRKRLERISKICEVPSTLMNSAFKLADEDGDGLVSKDELLRAAPFLGIDASNVEALFQKHDSDGDDQILRFQFAALLAEASKGAAAAAVSSFLPKEPMSPTSPHSGPSALIAIGDCESGAQPNIKKMNLLDEDVWPEDLVQTLAAYMEEEGVLPGEICLHLYPFGGIRKTLSMRAALEEGVWPALATERPAIPSSRPGPAI
mmetsp:Transcript_6098/g.14035  ORF Transcript_6098/g.14035 Transcript_6098/m.14035 type:complete len:533 (+) Transcript_6098:325-1923(+)|eukprot:CAMPEP_0172601686 /NCGR_PEP_ID=MMETSP1068-20121228/21860_1 /TAXON_ID=35684 /ORGANISM="Pseudopedinella elastica, Strain CCMP716" /LENGTH=532 /DNA_ID=CAMNT_0013402775 /DNA_START=248 /DNA_END=1846 /DNA_ORIENTATION=+